MYLSSQNSGCEVSASANLPRAVRHQDTQLMEIHLFEREHRGRFDQSDQHAVSEGRRPSGTAKPMVDRHVWLKEPYEASQFLVAGRLSRFDEGSDGSSDMVKERP